MYRLIICLVVIIAVTLVGTKLYPPSNHFPSTAPTSSSINKPTTFTSPTPIINSNTATAEIVSVIDGDTISVKIFNEIHKVRIIGIDTNELNDQNLLNRCFANLAKNSILSLLPANKLVLLETDSTQGNTDRYQRLLRHVITLENINIAQFLIESGLGVEYTYKKPYRYQSDFIKAQKIARENKVGIWSNVCQVSPSPPPKQIIY